MHLNIGVLQRERKKRRKLKHAYEVCGLALHVQHMLHVFVLFFSGFQTNFLPICAKKIVSRPIASNEDWAQSPRQHTLANQNDPQITIVRRSIQ